MMIIEQKRGAEDSLIGSSRLFLLLNSSDLNVRWKGTGRTLSNKYQKGLHLVSAHLTGIIIHYLALSIAILEDR